MITANEFFASSANSDRIHLSLRKQRDFQMHLVPTTACLLIALALAPLAQAVSKQDIRNCQQLGQTSQIAQCIALLKNKSVRNQKIACRKELSCWAKLNKNSAQRSCAAAFSRAARLDQRWASIWNNQTLTHARWLSRKSASLIYFRDSNNIRLECRYNPDIPSQTKATLQYSVGAQSGISLSE